MLKDLVNFLKNYINYFLSNIIAIIAGFILLPFITLYTTVEEYGILGVYISLGAILNVIFRLGLPGSITRLYYDYGEGYQLNNLITTIVKFITYFNLILIFLLLIIFKFLIDNFNYYDLEYHLIVLTVFSSSLEAHIDIMRRLIQPRQDTKYYLKFNIFYTILYFIIAIISLTFLNLSYKTIIYCSFINSLVFFFISRKYLKINLTGKFSKELFVIASKYALGVFPSHLIIPSGTFLLRNILILKVGLLEAGFFTMFQVLNNSLVSLSHSFGRSFQPIYNYLRKKSDIDENNRILLISRILIFISIIFTFNSAIFSEFVVNILTNKKYILVANFSFLICLNFLIQILYLTFSQEIGFSKKTKFYSYNSFFNQVASIGIFYFFLMNYGSLGAYISVVTSNILSLIFIFYIMRQKLNYKVNLMFYISEILLFIISLFIFMIIHVIEVESLFILTIISLAYTTLTLLILYKNILKIK